jgi:hypothetical protein
MIIGNRLFSFLFLVVTISLTSCNNTGKDSQSPTAAPTTATESADDPSKVSSTFGIGKAKPAPGTGNVQGKVLYNDKPVPNIKVKLCEKFNQYLGGCDGKQYKAMTDKEGEYVIANVKPKTYESLLARVFDTDAYLFATSGIAGLKTTAYEVSSDKTLFVPPTSLFKSDLQIVIPKAGSSIGSKNLKLTWKPYAEAAYYKLRVSPEGSPPDVRIRLSRNL